MKRHLAALLSSLCWTACSPTEDTLDTAEIRSELCTVTLSHVATSDLDRVSLVGEFNDWDPAAHPMIDLGSSTWSVTLELAPGSYGYRFEEHLEWSTKGFTVQVCDPQEPALICEEGTDQWPAEGPLCESGVESICSSMLDVPDCSAPSIAWMQLSPQTAGLTADLAVLPGASGSPIDQIEVSLNGEPIQEGVSPSGTETLTIDDQRIQIEISDLTAGHHTLTVSAVDQDGLEAPPQIHRFWTDDREDWRQGTIYFAFVDRLANGDPSLDVLEGASASAGEYLGGDWAGVEAALPYLDDLGVQTLWLSNPQSNAGGAWEGDCGQTYTGYHAYWPDSRRDIESHFGGEEALQSLIDAAHGRGMRVIMDWVGNHLHAEHPLSVEHNDTWFHTQEICNETVSGQLNWDRIPEQCWFAPYLPDLDYGRTDVMTLMLDDALYWAEQYGFDGFRVDAVKHMPHSVAWNLERRIQDEIERQAAGGTDSFWTLGETFDGRDRIAAYISSEDRPQLDGQFDFPLYYALLETVAWSSQPIDVLESAVLTSQAAYGDGVMANFIGNHDTGRFSTLAAGQGDESCADGQNLDSATAIEDEDALARMRIAWTFLFTQSPAPLIYYGDEIAMPGFGDPDNRQPLWEHGLDLSEGLSLDDAIAALEPGPAQILEHVSILSRARAAHPELRRGEMQQWWMGPSTWPTTWAWTRVDPETGKGSLTILNLSPDEVTLENNLAAYGLPEEGTYIDLLSDQSFVASDDSVRVSVPGLSSRVLLAP